MTDYEKYYKLKLQRANDTLRARKERLSTMKNLTQKECDRFLARAVADVEVAEAELKAARRQAQLQEVASGTAREIPDPAPPGQGSTAFEQFFGPAGFRTG